MKLNIPEEQKKAMSDWMGVASDKPMDRLLEALEGAEPALMVDDVADRVATEIGVQETELRGIIVALLSMVRSSRRAIDDESRQTFRDDVALAILGPVSDLAARDRVRSQIDRVLTARSVRVTSKALDVARGDANRFCKARTISQLRPVFHDVSLEPEAAVVVHELELTYHVGPGANRDEIYIAMDRDDLEILASVIDRALKKDAKLSEFARGGKPIRILGDEDK